MLMTSAEDAPDYHHVVEHPMDLSTILAELENHKYTKLSDVKDFFQLMFDKCFAYNPFRSVSDIYMEGCNFQRAFSTVWSKKDDWIKAQVTILPNLTVQGPVDDSIGKLTHDDEQTTINNQTDNVIREDGGASDSDRHPVKRSRRVLSKNETPSDIVAVGLPTQRWSRCKRIACKRLSHDVRLPRCSPA